MKYSSSILFIILFTHTNSFAQELDSTELTTQESSINAELEEEKIHINKEENSLKEKDETKKIPLEYVLSLIHI